MYARKFRGRPLILALVVLLAAVLIGTAAAKYVWSDQLSGNVTFTAKLADTLLLAEHKAERQPDGSYELGSDVVTGNTYVLLPGLDIPKDPYVTITGKTAIEAYLFIEVVDTLDGGTTYTISDQWLLLDGQAGKHGGKVYVYKGSFNGAAVVTSDITASILEDNTISVSQHLKRLDNTGEGDTDVLTFYASLGEIALSATSDAAEVYRVINNIS